MIPILLTLLDIYYVKYTTKLIYYYSNKFLMKLKIVLGIVLIVLLLMTTACKDDDELIDKDLVEKPDKKVQDKEQQSKETILEKVEITEEAKKIRNSLFVENDIYEPSETNNDVSLSLEAIYNVNDFLGFPEGNVMKIHDVCFDNSLERAYAVGIMSTDVAVIEDDKVIEYFDPELESGYGLKYINCEDGNLFVTNENNIIKMNGETGEIIESIEFEETIFVQSMSIHENYLTVPIPDLNQVFIYEISSMEKIAELDVSKTPILFTENGDIITAEFNNDGYDVKYYDDDLKVTSSLTLSIPSVLGHLIDVYNELWFIDTVRERLLIYDLDNPNENPIAIEDIVPEPVRIVSGVDYVVVNTDNGYDDGTTGGFLGGVSIIDAETKEVLHNIAIPSKHSNMEIDENNKMLYLSNNDGGSISRIDLETGEYYTINIGNAAEGGVVLDDGTVYVRNRLGGSTLMHINFENNELLSEIETNDWPVGIAYDSELDKVFTFDFLDSSISVIDNDEIIEHYDLMIPDGNTDGIGDMAYDLTRHVIYSALPEQNRVVALDVDSGLVLYDIFVEDYGMEYEELSGAGTLTIGVYEPTAKLLVYAQKPEKLYVYDGLNDFELYEAVDVPLGSDIRNYPYSLYVDNHNDRIYMGNTIIDAITFETMGSLSYGDSVVAVDNIMLTASEDKKNQETLYALSLEGELLDEIEMDKDQYVNARFAYSDGKLYAFYLVSGEIWFFET